jgi:hypothetical protein
MLDDLPTQKLADLTFDSRPGRLVLDHGARG